MNSARYFIRGEDDEPPRTPPESPLWMSDARCLKCRGYELTLPAEHDEQSDEVALLLRSQKCRQRETMPVK